MAIWKNFSIFSLLIDGILLMLNDTFPRGFHVGANKVSLSANANLHPVPPAMPFSKLSLEGDPLLNNLIEDKMQNGEKQFEYFTAAFSWPPGACVFMRCQRIPNHFVLHGLWPQIVVERDPLGFLSPTEVYENQEKLMTYWPDLRRAEFNYKFYIQQYKNHGKDCSYELNSTQFLNLAISLAERYSRPIYDALALYKPKGITPNVTHGYPATHIENAIKENLTKGYKPKLACRESGGKSYLIGIYICLDATGTHFRHCSTELRCFKAQENYYHLGAKF